MDLEKVLDKARQEMQRALGPNLVALAATGSAAAGDYQPGISDLNLVVVVGQADLPALDAVRKFMDRMRKYRVATPLVITAEHIRTSTDVFPIEFLEIKDKHRVLLGADLFAGLNIDTRNLRHECEHELKGRIIRMRQSLIEAGHRVKALAALLLAGHTANLPAFRTALRLKGAVPPVSKNDTLAAVVHEFGVSAELFTRIKLLRQGELKLTPLAMRTLLENYLTEVEKVAQAVDQL